MITMRDIKRANKEAGFNFFSPNTMQFFNSRIESKPAYGDGEHVYFLTSEQFEDDPREYKVRVFYRSSGDIYAASKWFPTKREAHVAMAALVKADAVAWKAAQV